MTYRPLKERIDSYLRALGSSPAQVADSLAQQRVTGRRGCPDRCPLARGIEESVPGTMIVVGPCGLLAGDLTSNETTWVDLEAHQEEFVEQFDRGQYPTLEERS